MRTNNLQPRNRDLLAVGIFGNGCRLRQRIQVLLERGREFSPRASTVRVGLSATVMLVMVVAGSLAPRWIAFAQSPFEVTTVKPSPPSNQGMMNHFDPERVSYSNTSLKVLIEAAYNVGDYQLYGGPGWLSSDKWDVAGKLEKPTVDRARRFRLENDMLQSLLKDRFKLALHRETRQLAEYRLVVAKNGSKMHQVADGDGGGKPAGIRTGNGLLDAHKMPVAQLAFWLAVDLGLPVLDGTGLMGNYDFKLEWAPDEGQVADSTGSSLFAAIQEQLGLKLESMKGPVEVLVIDHVEKPSEN